MFRAAFTMPVLRLATRTATGLAPPDAYDVSASVPAEVNVVRSGLSESFRLPLPSLEARPDCLELPPAGMASLARVGLCDQ